MPAAMISYYFSTSSPWAYLGHALLHSIAKKHAATINYRPLPLRPLFERMGGLPLALRPPVKQRYRMIELQRWRNARGIPLNMIPQNSPFDASLADRTVIAIAETGRSPELFLALAHSAIWTQNRDLSDRTTISNLIQEAEEDPAAILAYAEATYAAETYQRNLEDGVMRDVFGAPSYVVEGEVFWGQDRLELLDAMLTEQREPFVT